MGARDFDPEKLADAEYAGWVAYYRRQWPPFLGAALRMVRIGFGLSWPATMRGAWYVLRANQAWAPYPDNHPDRARDHMRRFYALVARSGQLTLDPVEAARLEVEWWRVHRLHQRQNEGSDDDLADAMVELYAYVYGIDRESVRAAARHRVSAMGHSDAWVAGRLQDRQLLESVQDELRASYRALRAAVGPAPSG
jgi:hypothetical protein